MGSKGMRPHLTDKEADYINKKVNAYNLGNSDRDVSFTNERFYMGKTLTILNGMNSGALI